MSNPVTTSLPAYVEQNVNELIARSAIGARTLDYITIQTGVKGDTAINLISTDVTFKQNAEQCGFKSGGTSTFTQRTLKAGIVAVNMEFCPKNFYKKYAQSQLNITAGRENLPFEQQIVDDIIRDIKEKLDAIIWMGDTAGATNLKPFDGLIKILKADEGVIDVEIANETPKFDAVQSVLMAIPTRAIREDTHIFCSPSFLRAYEQELLAKNLFHFAPNEDYREIQIPASSVKLTAVEGLELPASGETYLVAGRASNIFYGTDLENGEEVFKFWYSDDDDLFRLKVEFIGSTQVAFPDEIVLGKIAGAA